MGVVGRGQAHIPDTHPGDRFQICPLTAYEQALFI